MGAKKVTLPQHGEFWFLNKGDGSGPLAPLDHCDDDGNLTIDAFGSPSYAHVMKDGTILRYGKAIGNRSDLIEVGTVDAVSILSVQ